MYDKKSYVDPVADRAGYNRAILEKHPAPKKD